jgi:hypothetical protein
LVASLAATALVAGAYTGADATAVRAGARHAQVPPAARAKPAFPCRWRFDLEAGLRTGYVTAADSADCTGRRGSLTLSVRLLRLTPPSTVWHTAKAQTKTWRDLRGNHFLELARPCTASTVRAVFGWTLRNTGGAVVARHSLRTAALKVPGPDCRVTIG